MTSLAQLQTGFLQHLRGSDISAAPLLEGRQGIPSGLGLDIYTHAYNARLREALHSDHAVLAQYVGDERWQRISSAYIHSHPSTHRSLRHFGDALPKFLRLHASTRLHPRIAELAAFERALLDSFDAADAPVATWDPLLALPENAWPTLCPRFQPSLRRQVTRTNCVQIWMAAHAGEPLPRHGIGHRSDWAIWRDADLVTHFRSLAEPETLALDHFLAGRDFAGCCEALLAFLPEADVPAAALGYLGQWCRDGWVVSWTTPFSRTSR